MGTITKALEMLDHFSRHRPELGLADFVRLTGRDKATVHRHLVELAANGFLEQDEGSRAYRLGPAILRLAGVRERTHPARSVLRPVVQALAEELGELVHMSILQGELLSPLVHADPFAHGTQVHFDEAEMLPLHATSSGLAVLAFGDPAWAEGILAAPLPRFTDNTETDPARLRAMIAATQASGIAALDRAFDGEVVSQGVPVFGPDARVFGALSVAVPRVRAGAAKSTEIAAALRRGCVVATRALGGQVPEAHRALWPEGN
ncbi:IclR family transcriptional regulator [Mesobacterium pallidum]|uniref:IclR family transcriptional regulator n=1 Tax=Mesobacterium pallidum TaxID=2872037 RepID=UPI001EE243D6|nr:IclR family transcriptional regulator [Mesobacterium pallidum]